jgi:hypothetical protein
LILQHVTTCHNDLDGFNDLQGFGGRLVEGDGYVGARICRTPGRKLMLAGTEDERSHAKALGFGVRNMFMLFFCWQNVANEKLTLSS